MTSSSRTPTIKDVAARAAVSASTVSRAFSRPDMVAEAAYQRVMKAAEELGYQPNPLARSLALRRTGNVGLILPDIANPYFTPLVKQVQRRTRALGRSLLVADTDQSDVVENELAEALIPQVDGLIMASPRSHPEALRGFAARVPTVVVGFPVEGVRSVILRTRPQMTETLTRLKHLNHDQVAWLRGPREAAVADERDRFMRSAAEELGISLLEWGPMPIAQESGAAVVDELLESGATAAVAFNDQIAFGLVTELRRRGLGVPGDVSVIGIDDSILSRLCVPALTTIRVPIASGGLEALEALDAVMNLPERRIASLRPVHTVISSEIVDRATVAVRKVHR